MNAAGVSARSVGGDRPADRPAAPTQDGSAGGGRAAPRTGVASVADGGCAAPRAGGSFGAEQGPATGGPLVVDGVGAGWRPEIAGWVATAPGLGFCEVIAESVVPAGPPRGVVDLRERGLPVIPHGVRLSLGGTDPVEPARVTHLAACAEALDAPLVSEHISFVRAAGLEAGHLLPLPRTREALDVLAANVGRLRTELSVPLALEAIAAVFDWPEDEMSEPEFLAALLDRTGALLLLDVANVYANAYNRGQDPRAVLDRLLDLVPAERIGYVHVAGGSVRHDEAGLPGGALYHDTHTDPVPDAVLALLRHLLDRVPGVPVLLERDGRYPPAAVLSAELATLAAVATPPPTVSPANHHGEFRVSTR